MSPFLQNDAFQMKSQKGNLSSETKVQKPDHFRCSYNYVNYRRNTLRSTQQIFKFGGTVREAQNL